jgi:hypothetical protein
MTKILKMVYEWLILTLDLLQPRHRVWEINSKLKRECGKFLIMGPKTDDFAKGKIFCCDMSIAVINGEATLQQASK